MLERMSAKTWSRWKAFMRLEPSVAEMLPGLFALVAQATWNVQLAKGTKKGSIPKTRALTDFIIRFGDAPDPRPVQRSLTGQEQFDNVQDAFLAMGKKIVKDHRKK